jgi:hypothetical protein
MRFPQVQIGQRFTYQGRQYTKSGPLTASEEGSGKQKMILRSAEVALLDVPAGEPAAALKQRYKRAEVEHVLMQFKRALAARVRAAADDDGSLRLDQMLQLIERPGLGELESIVEANTVDQTHAAYHLDAG